MTFEYPDYLWLLLIAPAMAFFFWWSWKTRRKLMTRFIQSRLLPELIAGLSSRRQKIRAALLIGSVVCLVIALARPQWGYDLDEVRQRGLDIIVAIDTSKSMLAEDIAPNRLARAKLAALDLMQQARLDRLGLIAFAGTAFLQCPLTVDDAAFRESVESLDVNTLPQGGTAIAEAIDTAVKSFKGDDNHKVLVLFTDGEDQDSGALTAARRAADAGLKVFTIGIGSAAGEILRVKDANGQTDYVRDENGNVVKSHLNESLLHEIATATSASYLPLRGANTIDMLYQQGLAPLPKTDFKESWVRRPHERYHWPLGLAILLLMAETVLPERKTRRRRVAAKKEPLRPILAQTVLSVLLLLLPPATRASTAGALREYKSGNFAKAYEEYERLLQKNAEDARLHFNAGAAAYRDQQFSTAARHFSEALNSQDLKLQEQAYYNLGNALFRLGEQSVDASNKSETWEKSLTNYLSSLKLDANDADAKHNYEFVKQQLEELRKQQQQQQQNQNDQSKQNKDQQQQNQQANNDQQQKDSKSQSRQNQEQNPSQQSHQTSNQNQEQEKQQAKSQPQQQQPRGQENQEPQSSDQEKKQNNSAQTAEANAGTNGGMTPQEAQRLLDAQKGDEKMLPLRPEGSPQQRPIRDW